jgi:hypothetical protein
LGFPNGRSRRRSSRRGAGGLPGLPDVLDEGGLPDVLDEGGLPDALDEGGLPDVLEEGGLPDVRDVLGLLFQGGRLLRAGVLRGFACHGRAGGRSAGFSRACPGSGRAL